MSDNRLARYGTRAAMARDMVKRYVRTAATAAVVLSLAVPAPAAAWRAPSDHIAGKPLSAGAVPMHAAPDIDATAGILIGPDGSVLWSRRGDQARAMASTTKIMTALVVMENAKLNERVRVSARASKTPYGLGLKAGEQASVGRLLELLMVASSNDAAVALAEHVGGSVPGFVKMMNARAKDMGLDKTSFANPHGLDAPGHRSSPEDLATMAREAMKKPVFRRIVGKKSAVFHGYRGRPTRTVKSTDKLLGVYPGIRGVKTGFTGDARYSFVGHAERDGVRLTVVILGAPSGASRFLQTRRLLDWGFRNVQKRTVVDKGRPVGEVPVPGAAGIKIPVKAGSAASDLVFKHAGKITHETSLTAPLKLPVLAGQRVGDVKISQNGRLLATVAAIAATSTLSAEETIGSVPVTDYLDRTVSARVVVEPMELNEFDPERTVTQSVDLEKNVKAPVSKGDRLGEVVYSQGADVIARLPVVASESVEPPGVIESMRVSVTRAWRGMIGGPQMAQLEVVGI